MKYVRLGKTNLVVSEFCLGTMMFGGKTSAAEGIQIMRRAVEEGVNFIDTADVYNEGRTEEIVGEALKGIRHRVVLASKVGQRMGEGANDTGISRYRILAGAEASLRRLQTDHIDLYYIHWPLPRMNLDEMLRALEDLVREGKILYPALSNFPAWLYSHCLGLQALKDYVPLAVGQYPYNLIERGVEVEVLPFAAAMGIGVTCYRPLGAGTLTGKYLQGVAEGTRGISDQRLEPWTKRYEEGIRKLTAFACERGYTTADAALAWLRSHPAVTAPIVGISRLDQLEENLKGFEWDMTAEERDQVSGVFPTAVWEEEGNRFPGLRRAYDLI